MKKRYSVKRVKDKRYKHNYRIETTDRTTGAKFNTRWDRKDNTLKKNKEIVKIFNKKTTIKEIPALKWFKGEIELSWDFNKRTTKNTFSKVGQKLGSIRIVTYTENENDINKHLLKEALIYVQDVVVPSVKFGEKFLTSEYNGFEIRKVEDNEVDNKAVWGMVKYDIHIKNNHYQGYEMVV